MSTASRRIQPAATPSAQEQPEGRAARSTNWAVAILLLAGIAYVGLFASAILSSDTELLHGLTIAPILFGLTVPIAFRIARTERDASYATIILAAAATKLFMAYVQFKISYGYFNGRVDAQAYHEAGQKLAVEFRHGNFGADVGRLVGTGFTKIFTGIVYAIVGTGRIAGYMVFAWLGFLGLLLMARAFRIGVERGSSRRYLILVLFFPSLLYWPSAIGKEAIMLLGLGLSVYGIASLFRNRAQGILPLAAGTLLILLIRPHVALIVFGAFGFAMLIRRAPARNYAAPIFRLLGITALVLLTFLMLAKTNAFLDKSLGNASLSDQLTEASARTTEAGSSFSPATVSTPLDLPWATMTVVFRPFPYEASSIAGLLTAGEGVVLLVLFVASASRLRSVPRLLRTTPYVAFSLGYVLAFIIAFSRFANFGLLARQRVQVTPFLLVFLALPKFRELVAGTAAPAPAGTESTAGPPAAPSAARTGPTGTRRRLRPVRDKAPVSSGTEFTPPTRTPD